MAPYFKIYYLPKLIYVSLIVAKIIRIPEKEIPLSFDDLSPIIIIPAASKLLKKIMSWQLKHFAHSQILYTFQYSFLLGHSTSTSFLDITDQILREIVAGNS